MIDELQSKTHALFSGILPLSVPTTAQAAAQAIRDAVLTGKLKPGDRLVEQKVAESLGIGQPSLREALKELEYQGFVRKSHKRGTYVSSLTREDFRKILEVRLLLEALSIERAAPRITPEAQMKLTALVDAMAAAVDADDIAAFHNIDVAFHRTIWALADNEYLTASLEAIAFRLFVFGSLGHGHTEFLATVQQHRAILDGLLSRDAARAREVFITRTLAFWNEADHLGLEFPVMPGLGASRAR